MPLPFRSRRRTRKLMSAIRSWRSIDFQMILMPSYVIFFCSILKISSMIVSTKSRTNRKRIVLFRMVIDLGIVFFLSRI